MNIKSKLIVAGLSLCALPFYSFGQSDPEVDQVSDTLTSSAPVKLGEAVITSYMNNRKVMEMPASVSVASVYDIRRHSSFTVGNILGSEPGLYMGGDGVWAKNVNVRGLGEDRLVTLVDGNRVETATDLTASLSMIDVNDIERIEVIKGAQSSLYGTGAMGGIINVITRDGYFADKAYFRGNLTSGFASANTYFSNYLSINAGGQKWYVKASGTYGTADDMRTPLGTLPNSQFNTSNISVKTGFKTFKNQLFKVQFQRNWSTDVGIPGGAAFTSKATATYTDIGRTLVDASYEFNKLSDSFESLKISYFFQQIDRDVLMNPNISTETTLANGNIQRQTPTSVTPLATHKTNGVKLQGTMNLSDNNSLIFGVDTWRRDISSDRIKNVTMDVIKAGTDQIIKTNYIVRDETPLPDASSTNAGLFAQDEMHLMNNRLTLIIGARIDQNWTKNDTVYNVNYTIVNDVRNDNPAGKAVTFDAGSSSDFSWSANAGLLFKAAKDVDLTLNVARSYRAASLEEKFKYIDLNSTVRLGNPDLKPEDGYFAEMGLRVWKSNLNLELSGYVNRITNMIVEAHSEPLSTGVATLINQNIGKALLYGFDLKAEYSFCNNFTAYLYGSYVRGKDTENDENLPAMPPLNGRLGFRYTYPSIGSIDLTAVGAADQNKIAAGETATDGYIRYDLSLSTRRFNLGRVCGLQIFAGMDNIFDKAYTNHLATNRGEVTVEPGRNLFVRANFDF